MTPIGRLAAFVVGLCVVTLVRRRWGNSWLAMAAAILVCGAIGGAVEVAAAYAQTATPATVGCRLRGALPDPSCTPGAVFPVAAATVCAPGYAGGVRSVSAGTKRTVYAAYGLAPQPAGAYELDHLIPLELGGSNDPANLWPEAAAPYPGFKEKDTVEDALHNAVCGGRVPLADAQRWTAADWRTAYVQQGA